LKQDNQTSIATAKANNILGILKRTFVCRDAKLWKKLYTTYVRPHLEFAIAAWCPHLKKDIEAIEHIQHLATKIPHELKKYDYSTRCSILGLSSLVDRRVRGDLIQKFKIEKEFDSINWHIPPITIPPCYGHRTRFHREADNHCLSRFNFFNNRVSSHWNSLPDEVARAESVIEFKKKLDETRQTIYSGPRPQVI
jgi:ribonuclease P/MRP protein subunit RPP40